MNGLAARIVSCIRDAARAIWPNATPTKPDYPAVGLELVRHAADVADRPWFTIGGVDGKNVTEVANAGAQRIVVVRAIRDAPEPRVAAAGLRAALEEAGAGGE